MLGFLIQVDKHLGCAFSGLTADAKMLIDRARVESRNHWFSHDRLMPVESIAQVTQLVF
jgi:20S proteasome subunit alpha 5